MTSKLTRERIELIANFHRAMALPPSHAEIEELARMALAAMDSEPVAEVLSNRPGNDTSTIDRALPVGTQLYRHAQPAPVVPVVPEEATPDSIEILASARRRDHAVFQWDEDQRNAAADSWNACRAAMLAAAPQSPGSEPATVPGKWIPVSERMPERGDWLVIDGCDFDVQLFNGEQFIPGFVWEDKITHWMPLPASPQEVKGE
ncbi:Eaa1 [Klebsiella pneumoniae]|nr:DUF551 domain-containing protein [Klebsiella pneumoniae]ARB15605.1 Eaa protein [Klebsiella phage 2b LV-2017]SLS11835.1 Eaa1 [Klebsiella pneumoniae]SLS31676.1 Eaa1 [Klebsiella pneumoniae]SLS35204.1 Eaa1 [Klebsiella pneumoniae]SLS60474.1 Eaa1 [Klebsiella pneumoniae]